MKLSYGVSLNDTSELGAPATKLGVLVSHAYGDSGEALRSTNDEPQDVYLWTCADLANQIETFASKVASVLA